METTLRTSPSHLTCKTSDYLSNEPFDSTSISSNCNDLGQSPAMSLMTRPIAETSDGICRSRSVFSLVRQGVYVTTANTFQATQYVH